MPACKVCQKYHEDKEGSCNKEEGRVPCVSELPSSNFQFSALCTGLCNLFSGCTFVMN